MKTSPRLFFCASNALGLGAFPLPAAAAAPCSLSLPLGRRAFFSPRFACRISWRGAGHCLSCRRAVRCGLPLATRSSVSVGGLLACVSRLGARCVCGGSLAPAWLVPVNRCGRRVGVACRPLIACMGRAECVDCVNYRFSVDYSASGWYIVSRALMVSPFFVSWHVLVARAAFSVLLLPLIALVIAPMNWFLRGTTRAIFFHQFSSHLSAACLRICFCYPATRISISPRSSPRYHRHGKRGGSWLQYD